MIQPINPPDAPTDPWFVIWTESRAEKKVEKRIASLGLVPWLPVVKERHRWSDRWREVECPLFPGYLFARARVADWHALLGVGGVLTVVKHAGKPALLSDSFVSSLRNAMNRDGIAYEAVTECTDFELGDEVIVQSGVLSGLRGTVREWRGGRQLVLWVAAIAKGVAFTIDVATVKPAPPSVRSVRLA